MPTAVLIGAGLLVWWVLVGPPNHFLATISQPAVTPTPLATEAPMPNEWSALTSDADPSSVLIQTFQGGRVIRSGTGTIMSSDGLIVTVTDVVPFTSPSATYQVIAGERFIRAQVVRRNYQQNLALLKADVGDLTIAQTTATRPLVGSPLAIVGGISEVSRYRPYFVHGWLSYDLDEYAGLDTAFVPTLAGGRAMTADGRQVGVVFLRSERVLMVWMEAIQAFVSEYLGERE